MDPFICNFILWETISQSDNSVVTELLSEKDRWDLQSPLTFSKIPRDVEKQNNGKSPGLDAFQQNSAKVLGNYLALPV